MLLEKRKKVKKKKKKKKKKRKKKKKMMKKKMKNQKEKTTKTGFKKEENGKEKFQTQKKRNEYFEFLNKARKNKNGRMNEYSHVFSVFIFFLMTRRRYFIYKYLMYEVKLSSRKKWKQLRDE